MKIYELKDGHKIENLSSTNIMKYFNLKNLLKLNNGVIHHNRFHLALISILIPLITYFILFGLPNNSNIGLGIVI